MTKTKVCALIKAAYSYLLIQNDDSELAETFFNSIRIDIEYIIGDLFDISFWQKAQQMIAAGELPHIYPYDRSCRMKSLRGKPRSIMYIGFISLLSQ